MKENVNESIQKAYIDTVMNEGKKKFDLGSGTMGNGVVVWNRAEKVDGDYERVAHIDQNRKIKYYIKKVPKEVKDYVEKIVKGKNPSASTSQKHMKVFKEMTEEKIVFKGHHRKDNILDGFTIEELYNTAMHNIPKEKINTQAIMKEFKEIMKTQTMDANAIAKKVIPEMVKELTKK